LTRFALGRLQFETTEISEDFVVAGKKIPAGSVAINVHIPRSGKPLDHDDVLASYALASKMFSSLFPEGEVLFTCKSWLLDPWNYSVLSPNSNLYAFMKDFKIVKSGFYEGYGEMWRLFDCDCTSGAHLPRNSSLRRAYADRIEKGEAVGWGLGLFLFRNGALFNE
jgi:hypothetical protein